MIGLYGLAVLLLLSPIGNHPPFPYNWEAHTAWHVFSTWYDDFRPTEILTVTDGLMTDSGQGPLVGMPIWAAFRVFGVGLTQMRLPTTLLAAAAVPLLWAVGRRLAGPGAAFLAALLLALSPTWLLYGRTATLVGVSLVPAFLTVRALLGILAPGSHRTVWLVALQALLVLGAYAYAPIRFLWPLGVGLLAIAIGRRRERSWFLAAFGVTLVSLPLALTGIGRATRTDGAVPDAITGYYHARGEQLFALNGNPENYPTYLRPTPAEGSRERIEGTPRELAWRLLRQNTSDLARLLFDRGTAPALTHYYNPRDAPLGRLYPALLGPFLVLGLAKAGLDLSRRRRDEEVVLLSVAIAFTLPMLLTSRVHIGRLIFALPFLLLVVAIGAGWAGSLVGTLLGKGRGRGRGRSLPSLAGPLVIAFALVLAMLRSAWEEEGHTPTVLRDVRIGRALADALPRVTGAGGGVMVGSEGGGAETESIAVAGYRLSLENDLLFVDARGSPGGLAHRAASSVPPVYYGNLVDRTVLETLPAPCSLVYLVAPELEARFRASASRALGDCRPPVRFARLPR